MTTTTSLQTFYESLHKSAIFPSISIFHWCTCSIYDDCALNWSLCIPLPSLSQLFSPVQLPAKTPSTRWRCPNTPRTWAWSWARASAVWWCSSCSSGRSSSWSRRGKPLETDDLLKIHLPVFHHWLFGVSGSWVVPILAVFEQTAVVDQVRNWKCRFLGGSYWREPIRRQSEQANSTKVLTHLEV